DAIKASPIRIAPTARSRSSRLTLSSRYIDQSVRDLREPCKHGLSTVLAGRVREPDVARGHQLDQVESQRLDLVVGTRRAPPPRVAAGPAREPALDALGQREREDNGERECDP